MITTTHLEYCLALKIGLERVQHLVPAFQHVNPEPRFAAAEVHLRSAVHGEARYFAVAHRRLLGHVNVRHLRGEQVRHARSWRSSRDAAGSTSVSTAWYTG